MKKSKMMSFNSTLVRLEDSNKDRHFSFFTCFNSTLVRLEVYLAYKRFFACVCFNSTLVRLEVNKVTYEPMEVEKFQFHTGSIRRREREILSDMNTAVSIPHWFD